MILLLLPTAKCVDLSYSKNGVLEIAVRWVPALISNFDKKPARLPALISNVSKKSAGRGRGSAQWVTRGRGPDGHAAARCCRRANRGSSSAQIQLSSAGPHRAHQSITAVADKLGVAGYNARRNCIEIAVIAACPDF